VVADAGPLIAFGRIERLELLPQILCEVLVPHAVAIECLSDSEKPAARAIRRAFEARLLREIPNPVPVLPPLPLLDGGESAAIRFALKLSASVLMDEKAGRKIATNLGLSVIGSAGVLLAAQKRGLIESVQSMLKRLAVNGYHFADALVRAAWLATRAIHDGFKEHGGLTRGDQWLATPAVRIVAGSGYAQRQARR
jgi:predicted nucleic acid-binding protein